MTDLFAMGIDLGGTKTCAVVLDAAGQVVWERRTATLASDYEDVVRMLAGLVQAATRALGQAPTLGIGGPGSLTPEGLVKNANTLCLNGRPLLRDIEAATGQPARFANDANCLALSEATDGAGAGAPVVFAAILGTGTGAGITVYGRVLQGPNGLAGEWGHNPLPWADAALDPLLDCYCGQRGCNETLLSGPGITRDHLLHTGESRSAAQIAQQARHGDAACSATLARHTSRLARALAAVINLLDPDVIVLGGGLSLMPHLYERVPALWSRWVFSGGLKDPVRTVLRASLHGDASGVRGAAWLWR
ncbi:MAG TPA: ROK family protein [Rubrivivax sp.]